MSYNLITILGPTACGKTRLAAHLAYHLNSEIISCDSRQVFKGMNIGTGKDYEEYIINNKPIPVHLIDIVEAGIEFNVYEYQHYFISAFKNITAKGVIPILCGGSGLYIESVLKGYKLIEVPINQDLRNKLEEYSTEKLITILKSYKKLHNTTDTSIRKRLIRAIEIEDYYKNNPNQNIEYPTINSLLIGIHIERENRRRRISERLRIRLNNGMIEEVENLIKNGVPTEMLIRYGLEYKYITLYLTKAINYNDMVTQLEIAIFGLAKRQMTWFRKMERSGYQINWLNYDLPLSEMINNITAWLNK